MDMPIDFGNLKIGAHADTLLQPLWLNKGCANADIANVGMLRRLRVAFVYDTRLLGPAERSTQEAQKFLGRVDIFS